MSKLISEVNFLGREAKVVPFLQEKYNLENTEQNSLIDNKIIDEVLNTIPFISVMGVGENTYKLETQLYIDVNGGLKMLFFGGNKCLLLADRFFI